MEVVQTGGMLNLSYTYTLWAFHNSTTNMGAKQSERDGASLVKSCAEEPCAQCLFLTDQ